MQETRQLHGSLQAETARQDVAHKLDDQIRAAGTLADLQAKIAGAEKQLDATTKQSDEADQQDKALRQQGDELKAAIADATTARDQAQGELQRVQQGLADAQAKLDTLRTEAETNLKQARDATADGDDADERFPRQGECRAPATIPARCRRRRR